MPKSISLIRGFIVNNDVTADQYPAWAYRKSLVVRVVLSIAMLFATFQWKGIVWRTEAIGRK